MDTEIKKEIPHLDLRARGQAIIYDILINISDFFLHTFVIFLDHYPIPFDGQVFFLQRKHILHTALRKHNLANCLNLCQFIDIFI